MRSGVHSGMLDTNYFEQFGLGQFPRGSLRVCALREGSGRVICACVTATSLKVEHMFA